MLGAPPKLQTGPTVVRKKKLPQKNKGGVLPPPLFGGLFAVFAEIAPTTDSDMDYNTTAVERAFQLAKSGSCASVIDIRKRLSAEGFSADQVTGRVLAKQLLALIQATRG